MSKFEVIIPVVNVRLMQKLIDSIHENTLLPERIIIIDNTKFGKDVIFDFIPNNHVVKEVFYSETGLVNESLNLGIKHLSKDCEFVAILNDDIVLLPCFFQRNLEMFIRDEKCGVVVPRTVHSMDEMIKGKVQPQMLRKREGWAMTIRKKLLDDIPPIPCDRIATFHGDDWIWYHTVPNGYYWFKDVGNVIYHQVGASIARLGFKRHKRPEKNEFRKIALEKGWTG